MNLGRLVHEMSFIQFHSDSTVYTVSAKIRHQQKTGLLIKSAIFFFADTVSCTFSTKTLLDGDKIIYKVTVDLLKPILCSKRAKIKGHPQSQLRAQKNHQLHV